MSLAEIQDILVPAGILITSAEPINEGLANSNYRVESSEGNVYVFRICQAGLPVKPLGIAVSRRLKSTLPVPIVAEELPETPFLLFHWLKGKTIQSLQAEGANDEVLRAGISIGQALAKMATRKYGSCGAINPRLKVVEPWGNLYEAFLRHTTICSQEAYLQGRLSLDALMDICKCWNRRQDDLHAVMDQACLSHGDFKASNLLVNKGKLSGILDWDFVHAGTWLLDAGQVLRYMGDNREVFSHALQVGMQVGGLQPPEDWEDLARTVDLMNLVDFLNRPQVSAIQQEQVTGLIEASLRVLT